MVPMFPASVPRQWLCTISFDLLTMHQGHWFEPSQAHHIFESRFPSFDLARCGFFPLAFVVRLFGGGCTLNMLFKTGSRRTGPDRLRETVRAPKMRRRMPGSECGPVAKPGGQ